MKPQDTCTCTSPSIACPQTPTSACDAINSGMVEKGSTSTTKEMLTEVAQKGAKSVMKKAVSKVSFGKAGKVAGTFVKVGCH